MAAMTDGYEYTAATFTELNGITADISSSAVINAGSAWWNSGTLTGTFQIGNLIPQTTYDNCWKSGTGFCWMGLTGDIDCDIANGSSVDGKGTHYINWIGASSTNAESRDKHACWPPAYPGDHGDDYHRDAGGNRCHDIDVYVYLNGDLWDVVTVEVC
jgi:hypothetical protein